MTNTSGKDPKGQGKKAAFNALNTNSVGRYETVRKLGQGAAGIVYFARDPYIKRSLALKVSNPPSAGAKYKEIEAYREQFFQEAQSAGNLFHPNIVSIFDVGMHRDSCYIAMENLEGGTLERYCQKGNLLPINKLATVVYHLCSALNHAHSKSVVHRDIKPANIMFTRHGDVKITDFGIAHMLTDQTLETGFSGSPAYMSPEQIQEFPTNHLSDIFSLGCVVYEMLTGEQAFSAENHFSLMYKIINNNPKPLKEIRPEIPEILEEIILKALAKDPKKRFQNCMDFAYELRLALREINEENENLNEIGNILDYVADIEFFDGFSKDQLKEILAVANLIQISTGEIMVSEGDIDDCFYIILSGEANVKRGNKKLATISRGQCFGEMAFLSGESRSATVEASSNCMLLKISGILLEKSPERVQLLFLKRFSLTLLQRLSLSNIKN